MVGAIVNGGDMAWFFKLVGEKAEVEKSAASLTALFGSVGYDPKTKQPTWKLPDGWTDRGASGMRLTTLVSPAEQGGLELSVTGLSGSADWSGLLLSNLNRWRGQMKQPPLDAAALDAAVEPIADAPEGSVTLTIDGWFDDGGMRAPFASGAPFARGGAAANAPFAGGTAAAGGKPTINPRSAKPGAKLAYDLPAGWVEAAPSAMRIANLRAGAGEDAPVVTASTFPAAGAMGEVGANLNRWRGQVGLSPLSPAELEADSESVTIDGVDGKLVNAVGGERTIVAAMATRGDRVWFFKIAGGAGEVEQQTAAFREWVASVRFAAQD